MANLNQNLINEVVKSQIKDDVPNFSSGDKIKVFIKIKEGNKERIQLFEGVVIKRQNSGIGETFTVRKITSGVGVEKTFLVNSPNISSIEIVKKGKVRQSKIFYFRKLQGKATRIKEATKK